MIIIIEMYLGPHTGWGKTSADLETVTATHKLKQFPFFYETDGLIDALPLRPSLLGSDVSNFNKKVFFALELCTSETLILDLCERETFSLF